MNLFKIHKTFFSMTSAPVKTKVGLNPGPLCCADHGAVQSKTLKSKIKNLYWTSFLFFFILPIPFINYIIILIKYNGNNADTVFSAWECVYLVKVSKIYT